jgi:hypothetical protein
VAPLEMNEGTHWGQGYNQPTKGCSAEERPKKRPLTFFYQSHEMSRLKWLLRNSVCGLWLLRKFADKSVKSWYCSERCKGYEATPGCAVMFQDERHPLNYTGEVPTHMKLHRRGNGSFECAYSKSLLSWRCLNKPAFCVSLLVRTEWQ